MIYWSDGNTLMDFFLPFGFGLIVAERTSKSFPKLIMDSLDNCVGGGCFRVCV